MTQRPTGPKVASILPGKTTDYLLLSISKFNLPVLTHPVGHHASHDAEEDHDQDVEGEKGQHRVRVVLQLRLEGEGREPQHLDVHRRVVLHILKKFSLPLRATEKNIVKDNVK